MWLSRQEYWSGLPFPSPGDHILSELFTWPIHSGWTYMKWLIVSSRQTMLWSMWSVWLIFCDCGFHSVCLLKDKDKRLWKLPDGRDWLWGKLGLVLMGRTMLSKSLILFSVDGWGCVPSLLFDLRSNYGGDNEDNGDLLKKSCACTAALSAPNPAADTTDPRLRQSLLDTHG